MEIGTAFTHTLGTIVVLREGAVLCPGTGRIQLGSILYGTSNG